MFIFFQVCKLYAIHEYKMKPVTSRERNKKQHGPRMGIPLRMITIKHKARRHELLNKNMRKTSCVLPFMKGCWGARAHLHMMESLP